MSDYISTEEFKKINKIYILFERYSTFKFQPPKMVIFGVQSAGKTSLLEAYVGKKIGHTASDTATKCPVKYVIYRKKGNSNNNNNDDDYDDDDNDDNMLYKIGDKSYHNLETFSKAMKSHMDRIDSFDENELNVEIHGGEFDCILYDLPGLIPNDESKNQKIVNILNNYLENERTIVIRVTVTRENFATAADFTLTEQYLTNIPNEKIINVFTRFGTLIDGLSNDAFDTFAANATRVRSFFVSLHPDYKNTNSISMQEKIEMISEIEEREKDYLDSIDRKGVLDELFKDNPNYNVGVKIMKNEINKGFRDMIYDDYDNLKNKLLEERKMIEKKINDLDIQLDHIANITETISDFFARYVIRLTEYITHDCHVSHNILNKLVDTNKHGINMKKTLSLSNIVWKNLLPYDKLKLKNPLFCNEMEQNSIGYPWVQRLFHYFSYVFLNMKTVIPDINEIINIANRGNGYLDTAHVVIRCIEQQLKSSTENAFEWFIDTIKEEFKRYHSLAYDDIFTSEFANKLGPINSELKVFCNEIYIQHISSIIEKLQERWNITLILYLTDIRIDLIGRSLAIIFSNGPIETLQKVENNEFGFKKVLSGFKDKMFKRKEVNNNVNDDDDDDDNNIKIDDNENQNNDDNENNDNENNNNDPNSESSNSDKNLYEVSSKKPKALKSVQEALNFLNELNKHSSKGSVDNESIVLGQFQLINNHTIHQLNKFREDVIKAVRENLRFLLNIILVDLEQSLNYYFLNHIKYTMDKYMIKDLESKHETLLINQAKFTSEKNKIENLKNTYNAQILDINNVLYN